MPDLVARQLDVAVLATRVVQPRAEGHGMKVIG